MSLNMSKGIAVATAILTISFVAVEGMTTIVNLTLGISRSFLQLFLAYLGFGYWSLVIGHILYDILKTFWICLIKRSSYVEML